jgi:hypothetical protein
LDTSSSTCRQSYTAKQGRLDIGLIRVKQFMEIFGGEASLTSHEQQGDISALEIQGCGKKSRRVELILVSEQ